MTRKQNNAKQINWKALMAEQSDFLRPLVQEVVQQVLEAEMDEALGAEKGERTPNRQGYRSGYYGRTLVTRVGKLELRVPQDRQGRFRTEVFERYQRSEKALVGALTEMYVQGVSTRKVKAITEELCGHEVSASTISRLNQRLDEELERFAKRPLSEPYPYVVLDARYERVREDGVIGSRAVLIAIGIDWEGRRNILAVELANRESITSWRDFCLALKARGLHGMQLVISDDHPGLRKAIAEIFTEAAWQRCYVHFLRNALDYLPKKADNDCLTELRWIYDRRNIEEARQFFRTQDMQPIIQKMEVTPKRAYTIAAWIRGEEGEGTTDDKKTEDKKDAAKDAKKDGKADEKAKKPVVKKPLNVIYVADIDLINNQLLGMRTEGVEQFRWDNGPFVLNLVDAVAGENRYLDIRQRKARYATLRRIEAEAQVAFDKEEEARKAAQKEYDEAVTKEDEAIKKIEKEASDLEADYRKRSEKGEQIDLNEKKSKEQLLQFRLLTAVAASQETKQNLKLKLEKNNDQIRRDRLQSVARIQNIYKLLSLLIPPLIPLCVGGVVWVRRYIREREGISKTRMKT